MTAISMATTDTMTDDAIRADIHELAQFLCTDDGKAYYRRRYESWLHYWNSEMDYFPDEEDYAWELADNRRIARNTALSDCAERLNLTIAELVSWPDQYNLTARMWARARNAEKLAAKMFAALM